MRHSWWVVAVCLVLGVGACGDDDEGGGSGGTSASGGSGGTSASGGSGGTSASGGSGGTSASGGSGGTSASGGSGGTSGTGASGGTAGSSGSASGGTGGDVDAGADGALDGGGGSDASSDATTEGGSDASSDASTDGGSDASTDGGCSTTCNCVVNTAPDIDEKTASGDAPTATGGSIPAGKYELVEIVYYNGTPPAGTEQQTMVVSGSASPYSVQAVAKGTPEKRLNFTYTTSGVNGTTAYTCGTATPIPTTYSVVAVDGGTQLHQIVGGGAGQLGIVAKWQLK